MKPGNIISSLKLSIATKRAILEDLDTAVIDVENLTKALQDTRTALTRSKESSTVYFEHWQQSQRDHAKALREIASLRSRVAGPRETSSLAG